jgi:hypothetical protein
VHQGNEEGLRLCFYFGSLFMRDGTLNEYRRAGGAVIKIIPIPEDEQVPPLDAKKLAEEALRE